MTMIKRTGSREHKRPRRMGDVLIKPRVTTGVHPGLWIERQSQCVGCCGSRGKELKQKGCFYLVSYFTMTQEFV